MNEPHEYQYMVKVVSTTIVFVNTTSENEEDIKRMASVKAFEDIPISTDCEIIDIWPVESQTCWNHGIKTEA